MAKIVCKIGFSTTSETNSGVWTEDIVEKTYRGDMIKNYRKTENSGEVNDNINLSNSISIVADAYANANYFAIKYVIWMGAKWKVNSVEVERPRLILAIGGLYNE